MVDQDYINRSGDQSYSVGQRLVVREEAVSRAIDLMSQLIDETQEIGVRGACAEELFFVGDEQQTIILPQSLSIMGSN